MLGVGVQEPGAACLRRHHPPKPRRIEVDQDGIVEDGGCVHDAAYRRPAAADRGEPVDNLALLANSMALSGNFGDGAVSDNDLASGLQGAVIKDDDKDVIVWKDYLANVMKKRGATWRGLYAACQAHVGE